MASLPTEQTHDQAADGDYRFPMTPIQQAFWYLDRVQRGNPAWNIAVRFRVAGPVSPSLLQSALDALVARQDALRTTFAIDEDSPPGDTPVQVVHASTLVTMERHDLTRLIGDAKAAREHALTMEHAERAFALECGPLLRVALLALGSEEHILLLAVHHIIADGWSIGVLAGDLAALYEGFALKAAPRLGPLSIQFADYAVWKQDHGNGPGAEVDRQYWQSKLAKLSKCEIALDYPRPASSAHKGHILSTLLPEAVTTRLAVRAREHGCTLFAASLAVLKLLLYRVSGCKDLYVGTLVAGRDRVELEPLVGVFVNTLVLRTHVQAGSSFLTLLDAVQETVAEAITHQSLPFSQLMTQLRLKPQRGCSHFYSINFIFQRDFVKPWQGAGITIAALPSRSPGAIYDLNFFMVERAEGWRFSCEYDRELYKPQTVQLLIEQFVSVLEQATENPRRPLEEVELPKGAATPLPEGTPGHYIAEASKLV